MSELPLGVEFRPMTQVDTEAVLRIIAEHDEDDYENAIETYQQSLIGQWVLTQNGMVIGATGAKEIPHTEGSFGVSWTYLKRGMIGRGFGRLMLEELLDWIRRRDGRKVFVTTSDYYDQARGDIYRDAMEAYRAVGFEEELRHRDFYAPGESMITMGLHLGTPMTKEVIMNDAEIGLTDVDEIDECDDAYWLAWEETDEGTDPSGFQMIFDQVKDWGGRVIFMAFPSDMSMVPDLMLRGRFRQAGELRDYYEDSVHQVHFRHDFLL